MNKFFIFLENNPGLTIWQGMLLAIGIMIVVVVLVLISNIRIVPQTKAYVIERWGRHYATWSTGFHMLFPFIDRIAEDRTVTPGKFTQAGKVGIVNLKEQVIDFDPQPVITKDNVTMQIDTVIYFQIVDATAYVYGVSNPIRALDNMSTTTIRNIMGSFDLDEALTSREVVNRQMREILDAATDPWGIKVLRVEIKNIMPPKDIREAMEKQMRAERERRQVILLAQGEREAAILKASGFKESEILRAEAKREAFIAEAIGQAEAIKTVQAATAEGLKMIKSVGVDEGVLTLKAYEALAQMADGKATKIIVPSNLQGLAGIATSLKEIITDPKE